MFFYQPAKNRNYTFNIKKINSIQLALSVSPLRKIN